MNEARAILKNTAVLAAARVIERVGNLVLAVFISRQLGADGLGIYATAIAYFALISIAGEMGATNLLIREIAKDRARTSAYLVHASAMAVGVGVVLMGLASLVLPLLGYSHELESGFAVVILAVLPGTLKTVQEAVFVAHQRVELATLVTFVASFATVATSIYLLAQGHGVVALLAAFVVVQWCAALAYFALIHRFVARIRFKLSRAFAVRLLREIRPFAGSSLLAGLFARPEIILLSLLAGEKEVGYYSAALRIVDVWQFIPQTFMTNVFPVLSRSFHLADGRARRIHDLALKYLLALGLPLSAGTAFGAGPIVDALYGAGFDDSVLLLRVLALNISIYCVHSVLWRVLSARGEQGAVLRVQVVTVVPRLAGGALLISWLAALGAAVATPAALAFHTALLWRAVRRDGTRMPIVRLVWRFALAAAITGAAVGILGDAVEVWALVPGAVLMYAVLVLALRALSAQELAVIRRAVPLPHV